MEDILKEKDKLLEEAGLNSYYTYYYKRVDKGLNGGQKQSNIYDRVGYEEAEASLTDPVVSTCFYLSILPILQKDIIFKPIIEGKKSDIKKSKTIADFLNFTIKKLQNGGQKQFLFDLMLSKHLGCCFIEKVYDVFNSGKYANYYYYSILKSKRNGLWDFSYDENDNKNGFKSLIEPDKIWSLRKFISMSWLMTFNNPNGNGDFEKIWKYYDAKKQFILFTLEKAARITKDRQVLLKGKENSVPVLTEHTTLLRALVNNFSCYIPPGYEVENFVFDSVGLDSFINIIRELDSQIARAYLGSSTLVNESTTGAGNYNTAQNNKDNASLYTDYGEGIVKDTIEEQYMIDLIKLNFNEIEYPENIYPSVELILDTKKDFNKETAIDDMLIKMGILDPDTETDLIYLREKYNLPENQELFIDLEIKKEANNNSDNVDNTTSSDNQNDNQDFLP